MKFLLVFISTALFLASIRAEDLGSRVLDEVNLARTAPQAYARHLAERAPAWRGIEGSRAALEAVNFLQRARPLPALAWSDGISRAALSHVLDIGARGGRGHAGSLGESPWDRMARFGKRQGLAGENIAYGQREAREIVIALIVDDGVRGRGHRANLFSRNFSVAGVAVGPHAGYGTMCVMDFAGGFLEAGDKRVAIRSDAGLRSIYSGKSFF
ncbi:MAG: hypothetical protein QOE70_2266 [Chthoniobacter sp.]|jgi:hypothetical protein|nr:hypothetical protein [Chthoniobacter sp.]